MRVATVFCHFFILKKEYCVHHAYIIINNNICYSTLEDDNDIFNFVKLNLKHTPAIKADNLYRFL